MARVETVKCDQCPLPIVPGIRRLALQFEKEFEALGPGDPDRGRHRKDDPKTIEEMRRGGSA